MDWLEEVQTAFEDKEYGQRVMKFFMEKEGFLKKENKERWEEFFKKVQLWGKSYLEEKEEFELYGVNGWYLELSFWVISYQKDSPQEIEDYFYKVIFILWAFYFEKGEIGFYKNFNFTEEIQCCLNWQERENRGIFLDTKWTEKIEMLYQKSWDRFQYCKKDENRKAAEIELQYAEFQRYFSNFQKELKDCEMVCVNVLDDNGIFWYLAKNSNRFYLIQITDIV